MKKILFIILLMLTTSISQAAKIEIEIPNGKEEIVAKSLEERYRHIRVKAIEPIDKIKEIILNIVSEDVERYQIREKIKAATENARKEKIDKINITVK